jgi:hypothetical protein
MYTVAEVTTPDGVFYTARNDDRTPLEVVADGIVGYTKAGAQSPIYQSLTQHQVCFVKNIFTDLNKAEADAKKKTLIEYARVKGMTVLNVRD